MRGRGFAYEHSQPVFHEGDIPWGRILILGAGVVVAAAVLRPDQDHASSYGKSTALTQMSSGDADRGPDGLALLATAGIAGAAYVVYKILTLPTTDPAPASATTALSPEIAPPQAVLTLPATTAPPESFDWGSINWESVMSAFDDRLKSKAAPQPAWNPPRTPSGSISFDTPVSFSSWAEGVPASPVSVTASWS